jgi:prepilin-type processing-associated H-X9-DG protein
MKAQNTIDAKRAFTVLELMVVLLIAIIFVGLLLPALSRPTQRAPRIHCVNNLKQNWIAFRIWSGDNGDKFPMDVSTNMGGTKEFVGGNEVYRHFQAMSNELGNPKMVICPSDQKRSAATNFTTDFNSSHVSYFVGVDANVTNAGNFLAGDRNLTSGVAARDGILEITTNQAVGWTKKIHKNAGNILFADGHVEMLSPDKLKEAVARTGMATNRLEFP